jgi:hypothetical protein
MSSRAIGFGSMPVDSGTYFIVVTPWSPPARRRSCLLRTDSIVLPLHSLLKGIQEWIGVTGPIRRIRRCCRSAFERPRRSPGVTLSGLSHSMRSWRSVSACSYPPQAK